MQFSIRPVLVETLNPIFDRKVASYRNAMYAKFLQCIASMGCACYGFEVLRSCESPRHPFRLFTTRFISPPSVIVYDNAYQLHTYALNREPQRFKRTLFAVDQFHWHGHVGCSSGYNLDLYSVHKSLNSQVNEQVNAELQHIKSQLAYMTFDNFVFHLCLFLSIKNRDARCKIDVSCLSI